MKRAFAAVGLVNAFACADAQVLFIERPEAALGGSTLVAVIDPAKVELHAFGLDDRIELPYPTDPDRARIELLFYLESLAELQLEPGLVPLASRDEPSHALAAPEERWVLGPVSTDRDWQKQDGLSAELARIGLPGAGPTICDALEQHVIYADQVRAGTGAESAGVLPSGQALFSFAGGDVRLVRMEVDGRVVTLQSHYGNHRPMDVVADGTIWFGTRSSTSVEPGNVLLARAHLDGDVLVTDETFSAAGTIGLGFKRFAVTGFADNGNPQRVGLDRSGAVLHFDGDRLRVVHEFGPSDDNQGGVIALSGGPVLVGWDTKPGLYAVTGTGVTPHPVTGLDPNRSYVAFMNDPDGSWWAADKEGSLFRVRDNVVEEAIERPVTLARQFTTLIPYEGGIVAGGRRGVLEVYQPGQGFCDLGGPEIPGTINELLPFRDGFLIAVDVGPGVAARIVYFTKKPN